MADSAVTDIGERVLARDIGAGARLIRWLEDDDPRGRRSLGAIFPHTGRAHLIGVTGPPGAGKSTLVDAMVTEERKRGRRVGVIAVDPSSPFSGGAILGDRVRMQKHAADEGVFIRSMSMRGQLGGLSKATFDAILVLDAMGYETIIVETVGVGQDEMDVVSLAHTTIIVAVPGLGDEVQAIKAGLLEAGEIFVINKADAPGVDATLRQLELMLHLRENAAPDRAWKPPLLRTVATRGEGVGALVDALDSHRSHLETNGGFAARFGERSHHMFLSLVREAAASKFLARALERDSAVALVEDVKARRVDPYSAADAMVAGMCFGPPGNSR